MPVTQIIFGGLLVAVLLGLAGYYWWRQLQVLREPGDSQAEETAYRRRQARLRLACSALIGLLALLLAGALLFLEAPAQEIADRGPDAADDPAQKDFVNFYTVYWLVFLITLLSVLVLAAFDFWYTLRYGQRQYQRLQADRRAMIERQTARLRAARGSDGSVDPPTWEPFE